jgi:hypothetical protein
MFGLVDWSFIFTILVILAATLIGSYVRSSRKDRCLKDFHDYHVTVEMVTNRVMWGEMKLHPTGFELVYRTDVEDEGHIETSFILYKDEFDDIQAIYRYARDLTEELRERRARSMEKSFHPSVFRRLARSWRNFMSTATDSMGEALGFALGRVRGKKSIITDTSQTYITGLGKDLVGYVGTSYDPLLEQYVGTRVVMEIVEDDEVHEHVGVLKDYSADFLELLDVYFPMPQRVKLEESVQCDVYQKVMVTRDGAQLELRNLDDQPLYIERVMVDEKPQEVSAILAPGEAVTLQLGSPEAVAVINLRVAVRLDIIVPRNHALIRHRAERYNPDTIFDVGRSIVRRDGDEREIARLRQALKYNRFDAVSAAKLGEMLLQRAEYAEARYWLLQAQENAQRLPDNGTRVAQNLRQLERQAERLKVEQELAAELRLVTPRTSESDADSLTGSGI